MIQIKRMLALSCLSVLILCSSACKKDKNEPVADARPTLEEVHAKGAQTLNELLSEYEKAVRGEGVVKEATPLRGYGPVQRVTYHGFTRDVYLEGKPRLCYLNIDAYQGYYLVDVHSVVLKVQAKPFTEYEQLDSPKCGYIPTSYTDPSLNQPNAFDRPVRGCFNDGYRAGGLQYFRTYYIKVVASLDGRRINQTLPSAPESFEWNVAYREAL